MSREDYNKAGFIVYLISEFATKHSILHRQAYFYLKKFKGLDYLYKHYDVLHTFSFEDSKEAVSMVCRNYGENL